MATFIPRLLTCPRCGGPIQVVEQHGTVMPGEVVIDFKAKHDCRAN